MSSFRWTSRVYWEDTDGGGIVYYANYLKFLERARTEWLRSFGVSQQELLQETGIAFAVVNLSVDYLRAARLDDVLTITCEPSQEGAASITFSQRVYRGESSELLVEASVRVACVDMKTLRPRRLPEFLQSVFSSKESA